jgi:hypothetical protein
LEHANARDSRINGGEKRLLAGHTEFIYTRAVTMNSADPPYLQAIRLFLLNVQTCVLEHDHTGLITMWGPVVIKEVTETHLS